jgi:TolA-binding protein
MEGSKITLEYIRTLIWPLFALMVVLVYQNDISGMISRGVELDVLGVTIKGASGENLENLRATEEELRKTFGNLDKKLREQDDASRLLVTEKNQLLVKINHLENQLAHAEGKDPSEFMQPTAAGNDATNKDHQAVITNKNLERSIQQDLKVAQTILASPSARKASEYELAGFEHILTSRWEDALNSFQSAYEAYPDYHNVSEIQRLLRQNLDELLANDKVAEQRVLNAIIERLSWGAPNNVIRSIKKQLET